jgi:hypothetical protein
MGLVVLVKKMSVLINFLLQNTFLTVFMGQEQRVEIFNRAITAVCIQLFFILLFG